MRWSIIPIKKVIVATAAILTVMCGSTFTAVKHGVMNAAVAVSLLMSKVNFAISLNVPGEKTFMLVSFYY